MLEKVIKYFDKEYCSLKEWFENPFRSLGKGEKKTAVDRSIARCLGVAMFVQDCGVTYDEVAGHFEKVKIKLLKLLESEE